MWSFLRRKALLSSSLWLLMLCLPSTLYAAPEKQSAPLRVALLTQDPPAIDPLSPVFDPDSYSIIAQIFDPLVYLDFDGKVQPALATSWKQLDDLRWQFNLRRGVVFHNGEVFDAKAVKFTLDYILDPKNQAGAAWILNSIQEVNLVHNNPYQIIIKTHFPDAMLLNRLHLFSSICPPKLIQQKGMAYFRQHPVGTGPYRFQDWQRGKAITLSKNPRDWNPQRGFIDQIIFTILPANQWRRAFIEDRVDFVPNLSGTDTSLLMREVPEHRSKILKKTVLLSYWVLIRNQGALADVRVRKALNYAVNKQDLVKYADQGNSIPLASLGKKGEFGRAKDLQPYPYDPTRAKQLLKQSGVELPLRLKVLVADVAERPAKIIRTQLKKVGVDLALEVVSRSEWAKRIVGHKIKTGKTADYDLAINLVDNPIYHLAFHAGLFLQSTSPWSLLSDPRFDQAFELALKVGDQSEQQKRLMALDKLIHDQAWLLFTTQRQITAAVDANLSIDDFASNGHLGYLTLSSARWIDKHHD